MSEFIESRRNFIKKISIAAAALPILVSCQDGTLAQKTDGNNLLDVLRKNGNSANPEWSGAWQVPDKVSWKTALAAADDKGEKMVITGTVLAPDGTTPAPNTLIYLYHTDIYGHYGQKADEHKHGRYRGWMLTDANGKYEFASIRPASYPNTTFAAHIHMTVTTKTAKEDWIDSILFEGDKFISAREREEAGKRGGFNPILKMERGADGVMRGIRDIKLIA